jgi:heparan-alpha-glucosaminide N-acetyltransferase
MTALYTEKQPDPNSQPAAQPEAGAAVAPAAPDHKPQPQRLVSLDAYRGFIMLAMASGGLALAEAAKYYPNHKHWEVIAYNASHVPWTGGGFWDMIQPAFMFMVGVALAYSYASRTARGDSWLKLWAHAIWRSLVLVALGVMIASNWEKQTNWSFTNVLAQIGLGYPILFLFVGRGLVSQLIGLAVILGSTWTLFFWFPAPGPKFDWASLGVPADWPYHFSGILGHWEKNANLASDIDVYFLNLFPRAKPFYYNDGGYTTLNFIPSIGTMLLGLMAGELLLRGRQSPRQKAAILVAAGAVCLALGLLAGATVCPIVKRIWTPSWVLYSGGFVFWMLAAFYWLIDVQGWKRWAFPFVVVGMNSIVMYLMAQFTKGWIKNTLAIHFGTHWLAPPFGPVLQATLIVVLLWLVCLWLYRHKAFVKI